MTPETLAMLYKILLILFFITFPALIIWAEGKSKLIQQIGAVVICYISGLTIGNIGILPEGFDKSQELINTIVIPLAIPLLLFSMSIRRWFKMARATFLSLVLGLVSALAMVFLGYFIFRNQIEGIDKIAGMLTGIYTGGTPNLASIKLALDVDESTYIMTHTYDLAIGAFLLLFLLTVAHRFFLLFLRPWEPSDTEQKEDTSISTNEQFSSYAGIFRKNVFLPLLGALGISVLIFAAGGGLSLLIPESAQMAVVILTITTLGIVASLIPRIHKIEKSFQLGMYLILVFCLVVSSMADLSQLVDIQWPLFLYVLLAVIGALMFHAFLSWIFKVDADNMIIASVALSMSPPFVPVVAAAIKNKEIIISGIMIGVIGYAVGNYFGVTIGMILGNL